MSYKTANITDAVLYGGPFKPTHVPASIRITDIILDTLNEINIDDVFEVEALEEHIHQTLVMPIKSDIELYILSDLYKADSQVTIYLNQVTNLVLCGTGVINFYPTDTSLPTKEDIEELWKCGLKAPSSEYYSNQLVRREDLMLKPQSVLETPIRLYYNSVYTNVIVENRGVLPHISEADSDYSLSYMSTSHQTCNSYVDCKAGDFVTITIHSSGTNYDAFLYDIIFLLKNMGGEDSIVPLTDGFDILGKYTFSFIVPSDLSVLSPEYFIRLWLFDKTRLVTGSWVNIPESFSDGSIPVYTIDLAVDSGNVLYVFYKKEGSNIVSHTYPAICGNNLYITPTISGVVEGTFSDIIVSVITESGIEVSTQIDDLGRYVITMPEEKCHITVTAGLILDLSIVFSGSLLVEEAIYWNHQSLLLSEIELVCHVDEDISFIPSQTPTGIGNTMLHTFDDILIKQYMWDHPSEELLATLYVKTQKLYQDSIRTIRTTKLTNHIQILANSPGDVCPNSINYLHRIILRGDDPEFVINVILKTDQYNKIKLEFLGEPFIIKTTTPRLNISPLNRIITAETDWGWEYPEYPGIIADQFGEYTMMGNTNVNLDVYYHCFTPYSNVSQVPSSIEYGTIFLGGDKLNHSFYGTVKIEVARHSELYLPSTITKLYEESFRYTGFRKISIPGLVGTIPIRCFASNWYLEEFAIPPGVTTIEELAFGGVGTSTEGGCNLDLGNVSTIKYGALVNSKIISLTLPESLKRIDNVGEYYGCVSYGCGLENLYWNAIEIENDYDGLFLSVIFSGYIRKTLKTVVIGKNVKDFPNFRFDEFFYDNKLTIIDERLSNTQL